jgi:hypothetical protein
LLPDLPFGKKIAPLGSGYSVQFFQKTMLRSGFTWKDVVDLDKDVSVTGLSSPGELI